MKAAIATRYGPPEVVEIREVSRPSPGTDEILVRVRATAVNSGDARLRALRVPKGVRLMVRLRMGWTGFRQKILGLEAAGEVVEQGEGAQRFSVGDRVLLSRGFKFGCHAEYCTVSETGMVAKIPEALSYAEAAASLFGGLTAISFLEAGKAQAGEHILINNASGAVGVMAVQLAKHKGLKVTAVCGTDNVRLMRELGADQVVDYRGEDFTKSRQRYDLVMDNQGNTPFARVKHLLTPEGRFLLVVGSLWEMIAASWQKRVVTVEERQSAFSPEGLARLIALLETGAVRPVIGRRMPFAEIVEAHRLVDSGHKRGSLVIEFGQAGSAM